MRSRKPLLPVSQSRQCDREEETSRQWRLHHCCSWSRFLPFDSQTHTTHSCFRGLVATRPCDPTNCRYRSPTVFLLLRPHASPQPLRPGTVLPFNTIGNLVAVGVSSVATSPQPHSLFCCRLHLRRPFQWLELFVV
jgi:hypothetical protein